MPLPRSSASQPERIRPLTFASPERERIHAALIDLCYEHGYRKLSVEELCRRTGLDRADFERIYVDLEDCFCQAYVAERDRFYSERNAACTGLSGWRERLRASAFALFRILASDPKLANFVIVEPTHAGERSQLLMAGVIEEMLSLLDQGRAQHSAPEISRTTAESIAGAIFLQIYTAIFRDHSEITEQKVREMLYAAVLPYLGPEAAEEELVLTAPSAADL